MHARKTAMGFYEKLGYEKIGDEFTEVTIPHYKMEKRL
jgi:predicted GNAT family N-acyltransferase